MAVMHGGTDAGPPVRIDLSTNANPLGPSPFALEALNAPIASYPDPTYSQTRTALALHTGIPVEEIVVGAGATELIYRLVHTIPGPVGAPHPGFGEYAGAANLYGFPLIPLSAHPDQGDYDLANMATAFITQPGSPDGLVRDPQWCAALEATARTTNTVLIWDLAYYQLTDPHHPVSLSALGKDSVWLFAPNKAHGCTGLRAGWLRAPQPLAQQLRERQMSWILSAPGAAFLSNQASPEADQWVQETKRQLHRMTLRVVGVLNDMGWPTQHGHSPWLITKPPSPDHEQVLREAFGIKVRNLESQGMVGWWRLGTCAPEHLDDVLSALTSLA